MDEYWYIEALPITLKQVEALRGRLQRADVQPVDYSDMPELPDACFLRAAREGNLATPPAKKTISIKLYEDVLNCFKSEGNRYQTHINAVLRLHASTAHSANALRQHKVIPADGIFWLARWSSATYKFNSCLHNEYMGWRLFFYKFKKSGLSLFFPQGGFGGQRNALRGTHRINSSLPPFFTNQPVCARVLNPHRDTPPS